MSDADVLLGSDEALRGDFLRLFRVVMNDVGPGAQTFGAFERLVGKGQLTFASDQMIANTAELSLRKVRRHLRALRDHGWIERLGRPHGRRTVKRALTEKATEARKMPFAILPRWACRAFPSWSVSATFACVVSKHLVRASLDRDEQKQEDANLITLAAICEQTGLDRRSVVAAVNWLVERSWLNVDADDRGTPRVHLAAESRIHHDCLKVDWMPETAWRPAAKAVTHARKNGHRLPAKAVTHARKNGHRKDRELLKRTFKRTFGQNAVAAAADQGEANGRTKTAKPERIALNPSGLTATVADAFRKLRFISTSFPALQRASA